MGTISPAAELKLLGWHPRLFSNEEVAHFNWLAYADETLAGLCRAHPEFYRLSPESSRVIVRPDSPVQGRVGIVTGGGSGHLPVFTGCGRARLVKRVRHW